MPEGFLWEASPTTYPAPSFESYLIEGKGIAGGEKLQVSSIGMEEGQRLLPGSRFLQPLGLALLICLMASFSPSHPCLPPLLIAPPLFVCLSLTSPLSLSCWLFIPCLVSSFVSSALCPRLCLLCFFLCLSSLCLFCHVSILVCLSVSLSLSSLPLSPSPFPISVSLHSQKSQV